MLLERGGILYENRHLEIAKIPVRTFKTGLSSALSAGDIFGTALTYLSLEKRPLRTQAGDCTGRSLLKGRKERLLDGTAI